MKYLCVNCSYVYDESIGDKNEDILAGTKIDNLEYCPVCEEYDSFNHINEEIIYIEEDTIDKYEISHFIDLEKKGNILEITIGHNQHAMTEEHRITWVGLYDEYGDMVEEMFLEIDGETTIEFEDYDLGEFEIRIKCNIHNIFARKFAL